MASVRLFFSRFHSLLLLLLLHLGCFAFAAKSPVPQKKKKKLFFLSLPARSPTFKPLSFANPWHYVKPIFNRSGSLFCSEKPPPNTHHVPAAESPETGLSVRKRSSFTESDLPPGAVPSFAYRTEVDIFACPTCGEVFPSAALLDLHLPAKHAVSELLDGDSAKNVVKIIFQTGWSGREAPRVRRILRIHHSGKALARFEEYREGVKARAARGGGRRSERCAADGNELLRFHCSTFLCSLGEEAQSGLCGHEFCSVCGIIRAGFSPKLDGIPTMGGSRRAHEAIPGDMEAEFRFMNVKRAMLVCRVIAGRVARDPGAGDDKEDGGFDSVVVSTGGGTHLDDELLVFSPRAVLPCFVIVYTVSGV